MGLKADEFEGFLGRRLAAAMHSKRRYRFRRGLSEMKTFGRRDVTFPSRRQPVLSGTSAG